MSDVLSDGTKVSIQFTGKLEDGSVFDGTDLDAPFSFTLGEDEMLPVLEDEIKQMVLSEKRTITVPPEQGYGSYHEEMVFSIPITQLPEGKGYKAGQYIQINLKEDKQLMGRIQDVVEDRVVIDANHDLAGETLIFEIELLSVDA